MASDSSLSSPTFPVSTNPSITPIINPAQFSYNLPHKLDDTNFLLWRKQILPIVKGHGLYGFFDGSIPPPAPTIRIGTNASIPNPEFQIWERQDQLILAWLLTTVTSSILAQILRCDTTASAWQSIHQIHASRTQSRILDLKNRLNSIKKGSSTISEYITTIQTIADELRTVGDDITDAELSLAVFRGLGVEYNPIVTSLTTIGNSLTLPELRGHLLGFEARLLSQQSDPTLSAFLAAVPQTAPDTQSCQTNVTSTSPSPQLTEQALFQAFLAHQFSNFKRNFTGERGRGSNFNGRGRGRGRHQYNRAPPQPAPSSQPTLPISQHASPTASDITCQICYKQGHTAAMCWHRYKPTTSHNAQATPQVLIAEPTPTHSGDWFLDSGASSHISSDLNSMVSAIPYDGTDVVRVGNGEHLPITHIASSVLSTTLPVSLNLSKAVPPHPPKTLPLILLPTQCHPNLSLLLIT